jgi:3-oxoacyl-[acyl-carrier-protein] synthase-1
MSGVGISRQPAVALTGIGMMTSVGFGAYPACAALRAGIVRMRELELPQGMDWHPAEPPPVGLQPEGAHGWLLRTGTVDAPGR